jgi:hypothetical protein
MPSATTKNVRGDLQQMPQGQRRICTLSIETRNLGTPDQSLSPVIKVSYEIVDPVDDFPDGNYQVSYNGGRVAFVKSGGRYSAVR